jgi:hypothetical protein
MKKSNVWSYDIETFCNCFTLVAKNHESKEYVKYALFENDQLDQAEDLFLWLWEKPKLVGYNNLHFDGQVVEWMWRTKEVNGRKIYEFAQSVIDTKDKFQLPYKPWGFTHKQLDLMAISNYGIYGKPTSLKWLEFTTRQQSIQDLPYEHFDELTIEQVPELVRYNVKDVDMTDHFFELSRGGVDMRNILSRKFDDDMIMNQPNSSIGEKIVLYSYCDATGTDMRKLKKKCTKRKQIEVKDVILPYIEFSSPLFKEVKRDFENLVLKADSKGVIQLKKVYEKEIEFQNMSVKYALGGIHGCVPPGIYESSDTHVIKTYDVTSMYPNLAIANRFYPEHLGEVFCDVYGNILKERKKYPKSTDFEMNYAYKEAANSVYGKSNASYDGPLKDPKYTVTTTINGQLVLSMLGEQLAEIGEFLMWNTDGSEILIPRDKEEEYQRICDEWCKLTGIELEHDEYETMWIRDVNNYIAKFTNGKVKRKGAFCVYEDYIGRWEKNPSALIIPEAIQAYFIEGKDPHDTIVGWNNIHDFLYGIKGGKNFEYWTLDIKDNTLMNIDRNKERAIRYYCSTEGKSILKNWTGGKKFGDLPSAVPNTKGQKIQMLLNIRDRKGEVYREKKIKIAEAVYSEPDEKGKRKRLKNAKWEKTMESRYPDLDYNYYISEAWRWINIIESGIDEDIENQND